MSYRTILRVASVADRTADCEALEHLDLHGNECAAVQESA
jgi:hypothetical protein